MIERELANVSDLTLLRPVRTGPGHDITGESTIASDLYAIVQHVHVYFKDVNGRENYITSKIYIDPVDNDGEALDIRAGDWAQYTDWRGVLQKKQVILRASPWFACDEVDHVLLEIG